jgi:hypothetical protein
MRCNAVVHGDAATRDSVHFRIALMQLQFDRDDLRINLRRCGKTVDVEASTKGEASTP